MQTLRLLLLFLPLVSFGQTEYYVSAKGGLNVREAPNSKKVATLLYGEIVRIVSKTGEKLIINDTDEKTGMTKAIEGEWVEIIAERIVDYDYKMMTDVFEKVKGYVFDGFLKQPTFSDYIKKDYTPISTLKYDENSCRTYKSGVPFTGIAYKIKYGPASKFASRQTSPSYIVDYGRFGEFISPIIIKIAEYKNGVLNGKQKVIDPLNDLTREKIVLFNSENGDGDKIIMKYSNFEIQYGDLQIYIRPTGVEFFDSSGLPASNFIANFSDDDESLFMLFQEDFKNKYLQITYNEEYVREAGEYSHFENDYNRKYSNYIDEECYMFKKPISVEIIENFSATFNWCMASGGKDLTPSYNAPKKCIFENKVYEESCVGNDKYFVISADRTDDVGTDILVKYKSSSSQNISCEYLKKDKDFEIKDEGAVYVMALENNFLILDEGTGPFPRGLIIYDLSSRKKVLEDSYSEPVNIKNNIINYWTETTIKANEENCSTYKVNKANFLGSAIETRVSLDLLTLVTKELGEYRCSATQ